MPDMTFVMAYSGLRLGVGLFSTVLLIIAGWKICQKVGYNGAWSLLLLIPIVQILAPLYFAFQKWPIEEELEKNRENKPQENL